MIQDWNPPTKDADALLRPSTVPPKWRATWAMVGYFLKGFRTWRCDEMGRVSQALFNLLKQSGSTSGATEIKGRIHSPGSKLTVGTVEAMLNRLEGGRDGADLSRDGVQLLASAYQLPALMLDPLFSEPLAAKANFVSVSLGDFLHANDPSSEAYGRAINYGIPRQSLSQYSDVAFGHLDLEPGGQSDTHEHPGSELLLVLEGGPVELCLQPSGVRVKIEEKEFVHFRAEVPHSLVSQSKTSVFVVRFYQLHSNGTRQKAMQIADDVTATLQEIERIIIEAKRLARNQSDDIFKIVQQFPKLTDDDNFKPYRRLPKYVNSLTRRMDSDALKRLRKSNTLIAANTPKYVADPFGLALMLERFKEVKKLTYDKLVKKGILSREKLSSILAADAKDIDLKDLETLAARFGIESMLLYSFMYPSEPDVVIGRIPFESDIKTDKDCTMGLIPPEMTGDGISYYVPLCNLALSDMNLLVARLDPEAKTKDNHHPGSELAIPLNGAEIEVHFPDKQETFRISAASRQYGHYSSENRHYLKNVGDDPAIVFVARFYGWTR